MKAIDYAIGIALMVFAALTGAWMQMIQDTNACKRYYKVLPERERPAVCKEVLGRG